MTMPPDEKCPEILKKLCKIEFELEGPYACILNKYDPTDGGNKCRIIQLLNRADQAYFIYNRSGKVDSAKKETIDCFLNRPQAVDFFKEQFRQNTGVAWENRLHQTEPNKYAFIIMNYNIQEVMPEVETILAENTESLMARIFDMNLCKNTQIDEQKLPLGLLSLTQIKKASAILNDTSLDPEVLTQRYYSTIPTRKENTEELTTPEKIQNKIDFLAELENIYYISKNHTLSLQSKYLSLQTEVRPVSPEDGKWIEQYLRTNQGHTHHIKLKYVEAFEINKPAENNSFRRWETLHNKQLLWHGTPMPNVVGILTNSLSLNPVSPVGITGKMFGNGLYFANVSTKSAGYLRITKGIGAMFLCEVALGNTLELKTSQNVNLPTGRHSVRGVGRHSPGTDTYMNMGNDVVVPIGELVESSDPGLSLIYDEFIVYDQSQVKLRYLVLVQL